MPASGSVPTPAPLLVVDGVVKRFAAHIALGGISPSIRPGEIIALAGQNGAGKSTLMAICSGALAPDAGTLHWEGQSVRFTSTAAAQAAGIAIVHQEPQVVGSLSVAENLVLGRMPRRTGGLVDWPLVKRTAADALAKVGLSLPLHAPVATLGPGVRQLLAIARAVHGGARLLILDEPTSSLSLDDAGRLADIVRETAARGTAVVYISHRMKNSVLLRNASSSCGTAASRSTHRSPRSRRPRSGRHCPEAHPRSRRPGPRRTGIVRRLPNARTCSSKSAAFAEQPAARCVGRSFRRGDRRCRRASGRRTVSPPARHLWRRKDRCRCRAHADWRRRPRGQEHAPGDCCRYGARSRGPAAPGAGARELDRRQHRTCDPRRRGLPRVAAPSTDPRSGANGRATISDPRAEPASTGDRTERRQPAEGSARTLASGGTRVLLLDEPTRGVDVVAKAEIHQLVREAAGKGLGLLVASSDLPELLSLCDRIYVMRGGAIAGEVLATEADTTRLLTIASGTAA